MTHTSWAELNDLVLQKEWSDQFGKGKLLSWLIPLSIIFYLYMMIFWHSSIALEIVYLLEIQQGKRTEQAGNTANLYLFGKLICRSLQVCSSFCYFSAGAVIKYWNYYSEYYYSELLLRILTSTLFKVQLCCYRDISDNSIF